MWVELKGCRWLIEADHERDDSRVSAGVSFRVGYLDDAPIELGMASLAAQLIQDLWARPVDRPTEGDVVVDSHVHELVTHFEVTGSAFQVASALERLFLLLASPPTDRLDEARARVKLQRPRRLSQWSDHVTTRWGGSYPGLSMLRAYGLDTIDQGALSAFATRNFSVKNAMFWTNSRIVPQHTTVMLPVGKFVHSKVPSPQLVTALPAGYLSDGEVVDFTAVVENTVETSIATKIIERRLRNRVSILESLGNQISTESIDLDGNQTMFGFRSVPVDGKAPQLCTAVASTLDDLSRNGTNEVEFAHVRNEFLDRLVDASSADNMMFVAERALLVRKLVTCAELSKRAARIDSGSLRYTFDAVGATGLLSTPPSIADEAPYPLLKERTLPEAVGEKFKNLFDSHASFHTDGHVVAFTQSNREKVKPVEVVTVAMNLDEVVAVIEQGPDAETLVDREGNRLKVVWSAYENKARFRSLVNGSTKHAVRIVGTPDTEGVEEFSGRLKKAKRRHRAKTSTKVLVGVSVMAAISLVVGAAVGVLPSAADRNPTATSSTPTTAAPQPTAPQVMKLGDRATFGDGSSFVVHALDSGTAEVVTPDRSGNSPIVYADVEYCTGATPAGDLSGKAGGYSTARLSIAVAMSDGSTASKLSGTKNPRWIDRPVAVSDCNRGWMAFAVFANTPTEVRFTGFPGQDAIWNATSWKAPAGAGAPAKGN